MDAAASLRVLLVSDVSPLAVLGGSERVLWEEARRLAARHRVRILSRAADGGPADAERDGVRIRQFPVDARSPLRFLRTSIAAARRAAARELGAEGADVLHVHQPLSGYGVLRSPAGRRLPSLYTFHSSAPLEYRSRRGMTGHHRGGVAGGLAVALLWLAERACLRAATRIHVLSDFSAGLVTRLYRIPSHRMVRIPGGVDVERFRPAADRAGVRQGLGVPADAPVLLTVRNLEARMGLDLLLRAVALLRSRVPGLRLLVGGSGSLRGELEGLAASLGLGDHVRFLGFVPEADLPRYYQAADLFVLPTRELEGFGLVAAEALACGTPVVGTPVGAIPEVLAGLDPDLVTDGLAPEALARRLGERLERAIGDPAAADAFRRRCRAYAVERFAWDAVVARLEEELVRLARARQTARPAAKGHAG